VVVTEQVIEEKVPSRYGYDNPAVPEQMDYVPFGSAEHMGMLNLRKVGKDEQTDLVYEGYTLADVTQYGASATERFLRATLEQQVRCLQSKPPTPKAVVAGSEHLPMSAAEMWRPD